jgi:hypothetical protein
MADMIALMNGGSSSWVRCRTSRPPSLAVRGGFHGSPPMSFVPFQAVAGHRLRVANVDIALPEVRGPDTDLVGGRAPQHVQLPGTRVPPRSSTRSTWVPRILASPPRRVPPSRRASRPSTSTRASTPALRSDREALALGHRGARCDRAAARRAELVLRSREGFARRRPSRISTCAWATATSSCLGPPALAR